MNPDPAEISKPTDCIVGHACKGNATLSGEKKRLKEVILKLEKMSCNSDEPNHAKTLARKLLSN
jgi:hypothetical protein